MKTIYLFDVDGTLTPAKSKIDQGFAKDFFNWQKGKEVYISRDAPGRSCVFNVTWWEGDEEKNNEPNDGPAPLKTHA